MIPRKYLVASVVVLSAAVGVSLYAIGRLPERVPIHWNIHGEADGFGSRTMLLVLTPSILAGLIVLMALLPMIGPLRANFEQFRVTYGRITLLLTIAFASMHAVFLLKAAEHPLRIGGALAVILGLMIALIGNWMSKLRRNFYIGIRTPWTIANDEVWERTHRVGGRLWFIGGLVTGITGFFAPDWICFVVMMTSLVGSALFSVVYSFVIYRRTGAVDDMDRARVEDAR